MAAAVEAIAERKLGPGGPFHPDTPGAWTDSPGVRGRAQVHDQAMMVLRRIFGSLAENAGVSRLSLAHCRRCSSPRGRMVTVDDAGGAHWVLIQ